MSAIYDAVTNAVLKALESGVIPWRKPWDPCHALPANAVTNRPYRGVNVLLLGMAPYKDHRWLTVKQANELGGTVRKGERGSMAIFWKLWETEPEETDDAVRKVPILRYYTLFNVEQCDGLDLAEPYQSPPLDDVERCARAQLLVDGMPDPPTITERGHSAWYKPAEDLVQVPKREAFRSLDHYFATLFHELGHATGHERRLNRKGVQGPIQFGSEDYSQEELVAELTSAFCCATVGLNNSLIGDAASYVSGWLRVLRDDPKAVVIAAAQAQKAADLIKGVEYSNS